MLAWHKDLTDDQVFTSLLPNSEPWRSLGKMIFEALRNGLAHRFRPDTLRIGKEDWRFSIFWQSGAPASATRGNPNWLRLSARSLEERVVQLINAYEQELRQDPRTRANFLEKSRKCIREIPPQAAEVVNAWKTLAGSCAPEVGHPESTCRITPGAVTGSAAECVSSAVDATLRPAHSHWGTAKPRPSP